MDNYNHESDYKSQQDVYSKSDYFHHTKYKYMDPVSDPQLSWLESTDLRRFEKHSTIRQLSGISETEWKSDVLSKSERDIRQIEDSITSLRKYDLAHIANLLTRLHQIAKEEGEIIIPQSLHNFSLFVVRESQISTPDIGLNPDGCIQAVWQVPDYGSLAMDFLASGDVVFSVLFYQSQGEVQKPYSGVSPAGSIMRDIGEFADRL